MKRVREERISNEEIRRRFYNIPTRSNIITKRTLRYIGKTVRSNDASLQKQFLTAFCHSPKHTGGQQRTHRDHFAEAIKTLIPTHTKDAPLKLWGKTAKDEGEWSSRISTWWCSINEQPQTELTARSSPSQGTDTRNRESGSMRAPSISPMPTNTTGWETRALMTHSLASTPVSAYLVANPLTLYATPSWPWEHERNVLVN
jgi:hypothetical protein